MVGNLTCAILLLIILIEGIVYFRRKKSFDLNSEDDSGRVVLFISVLLVLILNITGILHKLL